MKALLLAAGKSTRTYPLTLTRPKPLLPLLGKTIIEHTLEQLIELVEEVILIVGYRQEMIREKFGAQFQGIELTYLEQKEPLGTGHAVMLAQNFVSERFLVLNGDDIYFREDIQRLLKHQHALLAAEHPQASQFGVLQTKENKVISIVEKPEGTGSALVNTGVYLLDQEIFSHQLKPSPRGEYEITDYIGLLEGINYEVAQHPWIPVSYPWSLLEACQPFLQNMKTKILGEVSQQASIQGEFSLGEGSNIKAGTVIEGPVYIGKNTIIGPTAYLRPGTVIGDNCIIGHGVEVVESIIMNNTNCKHRSYVGYSVIGENCNLAGGFTTADFRHDGAEHPTVIKGQKTNSGRVKLGAFLGDHVRTGVGTVTLPGRKIWPNQTTMVGEVIREDVKDN